MFMRKLLALTLVSSLFFGMTGLASAHVAVRPAEVVTAGFQTFTVGAPNEKELSFNTIKLLIPSGLEHVSVTNKSGWNIEIEKSGEGEEAVVKSVTWKGGTVTSGFREEFTFSAKVPEKSGELQWKAYQTYENGETVAWDVSDKDQPKKQDGSPDFSKSGPFSITKVVEKMPATLQLEKIEQASANAKDTATNALYASVVAIGLGLISVLLATRSKK